MSQDALCSWSGGKDSCFALITAMHAGYSPRVLLNVLNEEGKISRSHGIPISILNAQAKQAGLPIHLVASSWNDYEKNFTQALQVLKESFELNYAIFGDIDLQAHRDWEEKVCAKAGISALLPIWKMDRRALIDQMLSSGIETMIVSCNEIMGEKFLGKIITAQLVDELEQIGVDSCGENGEYHTLVLNCSLFKNRVNVRTKQKILHKGYWFSDLELA